MKSRNKIFKIIAAAIVFIITTDISSYAGSAKSFLAKGWSELVLDNDTTAIRYFNKAYELAVEENNTEDIASALLNLGICSYMVSYSAGMDYCSRAMAEYKKLEMKEPQKALQGRSKCLQLISTIYSRQGKYSEAIKLSKEALSGFSASNDTTGYLGLIYNSLGVAYARLQSQDSAAYFHLLALDENIRTNNTTYLPSSYIYVADLKLKKGNDKESRILYDKALLVADSTGNRQAQVAALLGLGKWVLTFEKDDKKAEDYLQHAKIIATALSDKSFYVRALDALIELMKKQENFSQALAYKEEITQLKDTLNNWEKQRMLKSLEVQFEVAEKERKLELAEKEKNIARLTNYTLWGTIAFLVIIFAGIVFFLKRINKRDKQLLHTKEDLVNAIENQKRLKEEKMQNELEFKESQLSVLSLQMLQKNQLLLELKDQLDQDKSSRNDNSLNKIITRGLNHDKEWADFDASFESLNKNFYVKLKQAYPDISPNDLKICALIKLNLSIKEMAGILNISPDSVKTARYRLRKKLQLNTEDNLTEFITHL